MRGKGPNTVRAPKHHDLITSKDCEVPNNTLAPMHSHWGKKSSDGRQRRLNLILEEEKETKTDEGSDNFITDY